MSKRIARSSEILDRADSFEDKMNYILFYTEQNARIWGGGPGEWRPGVPLHKYPRSTFDEDGTLQFRGNCARRMIDEYQDGTDHHEAGYRCQDCLVSWIGPDPCWMCGKDVPHYSDAYLMKPSFSNLYEPNDHGFFASYDSESIGHIDEVSEDENGNLVFTMTMRPDFSRFTEAANRAGDEFRALYRAMQRDIEVSYNQHFHRLLWGDGGPVADRFMLDQWIPAAPDPCPPLHVFSSPFEQRDIRGPLYDTAALYDPILDRRPDNSMFETWMLRTDDEWNARRDLSNALREMDLNTRPTLEPVIDRIPIASYEEIERFERITRDAPSRPTTNDSRNPRQHRLGR